MHGKEVKLLDHFSFNLYSLSMFKVLIFLLYALALCILVGDFIKSSINFSCVWVNIHSICVSSFGHI